MTIFEKIINAIKGKWMDVTSFMKEKAIPVTLVVVNAIKKAVDTGVIDFAVGMTKTKTDDAILLQVKNWLPKAMLELTTADAIIKAHGTNEQIIASIIEWLSKQSITFQNNFYVGLAGKLNLYLADGKISVGEAISVGQYVFENINK